MINPVRRIGSNIADSSQTLTWLLFRALGSTMFMTHGYAKLFGENPQAFMGEGITVVDIGGVIVFPMPLEINALFIAGVVELFGGFLILIGLWTQLIALIAAVIMAMAYLTAHLAWFPTLNRGELAAMYFISFMILFAFGPGPVSLDSYFARKRQEKFQEKMEANM